MTNTQEKKIVKGKHKLNDKEKIENSENLSVIPTRIFS